LAAPGALPVPASLHFTGSVTRGLALGDLDGDGLLDAVAVNEFGPGLTLLTSVSPLPAGIVPFGAGTGGCQGTLGILGNSPPAIGNAGFAVTATNAPASSLGLLLIGDAVSLFGFDPFSLGVQLHVDPYLSMFLVGLDIWSDASGGAHLTVPIPGNPLLTGFGYFAQALFLESPAGGGVCTPSPFGLVASRGLSIVLQP
jgi:hypothetical protein